MRRSYTFIIAGHAGAKVRRTSFSYPLLLALGACCFIGLLAAGIATYHYGRMLAKVRDYNQLLAENNAFRSENHDYRIQTAQLGEKIDFLETTSRKLMILSGLDSRDGLGGVGGFSTDNLTKPLLPAAGTLQAIDEYNQDVAGLEESYRGLKNFFYDKALIAAATPSIWPVKGYVTGGMGRRDDPFSGSGTDYHTGVDISAPYGSRVIAPADGTVVFAGLRAGYGNIVVIDHRFGTATRYAHLWRSNVQVGQHVSRHEVIGYVGSTGRATGPHLHYELWVHNRAVNPLSFIRGPNKTS